MTDTIQKKREEEQKKYKEYLNDRERVKRIINTRLNNEEGYFVFDFIKREIFNEEHQVIDLNPQMLAYNKGKESVFKYLMSLIEDDTKINYLDYRNGR